MPVRAPSTVVSGDEAADVVTGGDVAGDTDGALCDSGGAAADAEIGRAVVEETGFAVGDDARPALADETGPPDDGDTG